jgi:hypothetical protein
VLRSNENKTALRFDASCQCIWEFGVINFEEVFYLLGYNTAVRTSHPTNFEEDLAKADLQGRQNFLSHEVKFSVTLFQCSPAPSSLLEYAFSITIKFSSIS